MSIGTAWPNDPFFRPGNVVGAIDDTGSNALYNLGTDAFGNMAIGAALSTVVPGVVPNHAGFNTAVGRRALSHLTLGSFNSAFGNGALGNFTSAVYASEPLGGENTAMGEGASGALIDGYWNVAVGRSALVASTHGIQNTAIGALALASLNGNGANDILNTAVGFEAMNNATSGNNNTAIGSQALSNGIPLTGNNNTGLGNSALFQLTSGSNNTGVGVNALRALTTASNATAMGQNALAFCNSAQNTAVGYFAGVDTSQTAGVAAGTSNTFIGFSSAPVLATDPTNATAVGALTLVASGATAIGQAANASGTNSLAVGAGASVSTNSNATAISPGASAGAAGAVAIGRDNAGTGASTVTANVIALGTALHQVQLKNNTTGAGSAALGANCPAVTATAPYTWFKMMSSDGSTVFVPCWK